MSAAGERQGGAEREAMGSDTLASSAGAERRSDGVQARCPKCCRTCGHRKSAHGPLGCRRCQADNQRKRKCRSFRAPMEVHET